MKTTKTISKELVRNFLTENGLNRELLPFMEDTFKHEVKALENELCTVIENFFTSKEDNSSTRAHSIVKSIQEAEIKRNEELVKRNEETDRTKHSICSYNMEHGGYIPDETHKIGFYFLSNKNRETMNVFIVNGTIYEVFTIRDGLAAAPLYSIPLESFETNKIIEFFKDKEAGEVILTEDEMNEACQLFDVSKC
ncbi:hypothetical protein bcgnr5369_36360 [Bacillus cereus]|uniref:Uncharacterized protein n=3 Tax=Bacillus cereus group TaxID=86661 RepID=A0A9X6WR38_BACTU|nr:hypothetical protein [Bacillus thuringiensis]PFJ42705.1 hypothetical protein COJ15_05025 [Bacillus thuringiensis]